jgi:hypothetical protein
MKRPGENLARTVDGAQYNKLQRPDNFPITAPRPIQAPPEALRDKFFDEKDWRTAKLLDDEEENCVLPRRRGVEKREQLNAGIDVVTGTKHALALPVLESDEGSDEGESFDVMSYIRAVRSVQFALVPLQSSRLKKMQFRCDGTLRAFGLSRRFANVRRPSFISVTILLRCYTSDALNAASLPYIHVNQLTKH